jgi:hypothetical protein
MRAAEDFYFDVFEGDELAAVRGPAIDAAVRALRSGS